MIDLSTLQPGDTVVMRCGGRIEVEHWKYDNNCSPPQIRMTYVGGISHHYAMDGAYVSGCETPFDIVAIEPKPQPKMWVSYHWFDPADGNFGGRYEREADARQGSLSGWKHFKITIQEGQPPKIEEV